MHISHGLNRCQRRWQASVILKVTALQNFLPGHSKPSKKKLYGVFRVPRRARAGTLWHQRAADSGKRVVVVRCL